MDKITVQFATRLRGFFKQLMSSKKISFKILSSTRGTYETNSRIHNLKVKLVRSKLADILGIIQRINVTSDSTVSIIGSYNRFLKSDKPYFIYVENPTALYHYTLGRVRSYMGKKRIKDYMQDPNLKGFVYMSKACEQTFNTLVDVQVDSLIKTQIYPLIPTNPYISESNFIIPKSPRNLNLLYISQGIRFKSKGGLEIIEAFKRIEKEYSDIQLTIVTNVETLEEYILRDIRNYPNIILKDFKLSYDEMQKLYAESDILLQPTSDDSCSLTILEALHSGLAFIVSSLYSIPEIVEDGINGFLVEPHFWFFSKDTNLPNPDVWNHREKTIYSGQISERLTLDLISRIKTLIEDPRLLYKMKRKSWDKAQKPPFSEEYIAEQWNNFIFKIYNATI